MNTKYEEKDKLLIFEITEEIKNNYNLIGIIDFIFAKAKYSRETNSISPIISEKNKEKY